MQQLDSIIDTDVSLLIQVSKPTRCDVVSVWASRYA